jgi:hypothetical protein
MGNSVFEMNPHSQETENLLRVSPEFFEKAVKFLAQEVKNLKAMLKESKKA